MTTADTEALLVDARVVAARIFAKMRAEGPESLTGVERQAAGWAVRLLERPGVVMGPRPTGEPESEASPPSHIDTTG
jgi:ABC-type ATPase involved in cell division